MSGTTNPFEELIRNAKAQGMPIMIIGGPGGFPGMPSVPAPAAAPPPQGFGAPPPPPLGAGPPFAPIPGAGTAPSFGPPSMYPGFAPPPQGPSYGMPPFTAPQAPNSAVGPGWAGAPPPFTTSVPSMPFTPTTPIHSMPSVPTAPPPGAGPAPTAEGGDVRSRMLTQQNEQLMEEVQVLRTRLAAASKERDDAGAALQASNARALTSSNGVGHATAPVNSALEAHARALEGRVGAAESAATSLAHERDALNAKVRELQELVAGMRQAGVAPGGGLAAPGLQLAPQAEYTSYPINVLGLDDAVLKAIHKAAGNEIKTVGELHAVFKAGKISAKTEKNPSGRFTKDQCMVVAERLLGRVPPSMPDGGVAAPPAAAPASPGVPAGVKDRPWPERLDSARKKERKLAQVRTEFTRCKGELERLQASPQAPADAVAALNKQMNELDKVAGLLSGQVLALLFATGLYEVEWSEQKKAACTTVDGALREAGLLHLVEMQPGVAK
jgi:hypothetical protein